LLHLLSPRFLLRHSRYAVLAIVIAAAIITPTPDVFNLMLFAIPMCALYFVGVFAGLALVMRREGRTLPWRTIVWIVLILILAVAGIAAAMLHFHVHFTPKWPYLTK
jgi:sec-independent protein translocase protein TatC